MAANTVKFLRVVRNVANGLKAVSSVQVYTPLTSRRWTNGDFRVDASRFYASEGVGVATSDKTETDEDTKKREASWKAMKYGFIAFGVSFGFLGSYAIYELGSPETDEQGNVVEDEFSSMPLPIQYLRRTWRQMNYFKKLIREPSREKLLPDPLTYPYQQPPYTLVLEMKDVLVHPDWTYKTGWRFKKRPGVDQFLEQVSFPLFEVVIFTAEQGMTVFPILDALDPNGYIMYRLVRDATHFVDGHHVKNLDCLNRDLSKVIVVDWDGESVKFHKRNTLILPRWKGNDDDKTLLDLAAFLRTIALAKVEDVRDVLDYYHQFDDPIEAFKENQRKLLEQMEEQKKQEEKNRNSALTKNWVSSLVQQRRL
ncbi:mitochondrial import inner membrane translocase subunit TIM50-C-like [Schistocerca nitens]|uniref:mitochondrial import inner membrane translocase subunit TIM50-C-like n=1 Tax=Schistocerca nitens TaxID=7011 RepID=UPI0021196FAF|nr:mitochondrial import inner membrane translocase subunit TIM50-C-like [Schistocerca nitens]